MPEETHTERNIFIVIGAVVIVAGGAYLALHHSSPTPALVPDSQSSVQQPTTPEQKAQVLYHAGTGDSSPDPAAHQQIIQSAQMDGTASAPPPSQPLSPEEKMKLLHGGN